METVDYTKMRVGRVISRWTYTKRDGSTGHGAQKIVRCPCGKNAIRELCGGTFEFVHKLTRDTSSGLFAVVSDKEVCRFPAPEELKLEYGNICMEIGCWLPAGKDTQGLCSRHQIGPSGGEIKRAIEALLATERLGEEQFAEDLARLRKKLRTHGGL